MNQIAFEGRHGPSVETAALAGDLWTLRILRECFLNVRRFESFHSRLKMDRAQLMERLDMLAGQGLLRRICYQDMPRVYEYVLTEKGFDLGKIVFSLLPLRGRRARSADAHLGHERPVPATIFNRMMICPDCGELLATETRRRFDAGRASGSARSLTASRSSH